MATVSLSMVPYISIVTGVPRMLYVRVPYGNPFGEPGDAQKQTGVLLAALRWLYDAPEPNYPAHLRVGWRRSRPRPHPPE